MADSSWNYGYQNSNKNQQSLTLTPNLMQQNNGIHDIHEHKSYHDLLSIASPKSNKFQFHHTKSLQRINIKSSKNACNATLTDYDNLDQTYNDDEKITKHDKLLGIHHHAVDYKLVTKSLRNLLNIDDEDDKAMDKNETNLSLISLPLSTQINVLTYVDIDEKFYLCRFVCRYWYHLMTWHEHIPTKQLEFLFPKDSSYILSSPFINEISRGNHAMILSSLGIGIYVNNQFHLMCDKRPTNHCLTLLNVDNDIVNGDDYSKKEPECDNKENGDDTKEADDKHKKREAFTKIQLRHHSKQLETKDIKAISKFLSVNPNITLLDLSDCKLTDFLVELLSYGIKHNQSLQHVMLSKNNLSSHGCKYIGYCLQFNQSVQTLWIRSNNIQNDGLKYIAQGLHFNNTLTKISFDDNNISNNRYKFYETLLSETIQINQNNAKSISNNNLLQHIKKMSASDLFNKLKTKEMNITSLSSLSLLAMKRTESDASGTSSSSLDDNDNAIQDIKYEYKPCDNDFLFSVERISAFNVPLIKLNQNEINTQSYIANHYPDYDGSSCDIDEEFVNRIDGFLMFAHLFANTRNKSKLEIVSFRQNKISSTGVTLLSKALINNAILKQLHFSYNNIDERAVLSVFSLLKYYDETKNDIQRKYGLDVYIKTGNKQLDEATNLWTEIEEEYNTDTKNDRARPFGHIF